MFSDYIQRIWYQPIGLLAILLLPLSLLFCIASLGRRCFYRMNIMHSEKVPVPVIVVGNITVGGTGKTPLVVAITQYLKAQGYRPGVVCRGYGGKAHQWPQQVNIDSDPEQVGDEAVLIANRCRCPVIAGPDRAHSAKSLIENDNCNVIILDDGLQHYRLKRDIEIAVIDAARGFGNRLCLPSGPLRELPFRLKSVTMTVTNGKVRGEAGQDSMYAMELKSYAFHHINDESKLKPLDAFNGLMTHAISGIGNNERFYQHLRQLGILITAHPFPDHYLYRSRDLHFKDTYPVLMTEKDAVKCRKYLIPDAWYLKVDAQLGKRFYENLDEKLRKIHGQKIT